MGRLYVVLLLILLAISIFVMGCAPQKVDGTAGRHHRRIRVGNFFDHGENDQIADRFFDRSTV